MCISLFLFVCVCFVFGMAPLLSFLLAKMQTCNQYSRLNILLLAANFFFWPREGISKKGVSDNGVDVWRVYVNDIFYRSGICKFYCMIVFNVNRSGWLATCLESIHVVLSYDPQFL